MSAAQPSHPDPRDPTDPSLRRQRRGATLVLLPLIVFGTLAILFLTQLLSGRDPQKLPSALVGRPAPAMVLAPLEGLLRGGTPVPGLDTAALAAGRVTIVNVFASWCPPCHAEHPLLLKLAEDGRFDLVGINQKDTPENARRFLTAKGNPFRTVGVDPNGRASIEWGVYGLPETFVVDGLGVVRHKHVGPLTEANLPRFVAAVEAVLAR